MQAPLVDAGKLTFRKNLRELKCCLIGGKKLTAVDTE